MYDRRYEDARAEWLEGLRAWEAGENPDRAEYKRDDGSDYDWWEWSGGPPERDYYRPWRDEEATWYQLWQTVSEGTPVSPPFETKEELVDYLAEHGDFWDQQRCKEPGWPELWGGTPGVSGWGRKTAEAFVMGPGWAPSAVSIDGKLVSGVKAVALKEEERAHDNQPA